MSVEGNSNIFLQKDNLDISSDGSTVHIKSLDDDKSLELGEIDINKYIGWIPEVSDSHALGASYRGGMYACIEIKNTGNKYLVMKSGTTELYRLPLSNKKTNPLQVRLSDGSIMSLEATNSANKKIENEAAKQSDKTNYNSTLAKAKKFKKALHIGSGTDEYIVCSTCTISCDMGCSSNTVSEITNACNVYAVCTSNCLGTCKTSCQSGSTGWTAWQDCDPVGIPPVGEIDLGPRTLTLLELQFGGNLKGIMPTCFKNCGNSCHTVCSDITREHANLEELSSSDPELSGTSRRKTACNDNKEDNLITSSNQSIEIKAYCKNTCEGTCYKWCGYECDTSCMLDNNCSYFADSSIARQAGTSMVTSERLKGSSNNECLWCKFTLLLFPI